MKSKVQRDGFKFLNFSLQPSEIIKPVFVILSAWCISKSIEDKKFYLIILFIFFYFTFDINIMQPDLGMTVIISSTFLSAICCWT